MSDSLFTINSICYNRESLLRLCDEKVEFGFDWEQSLYLFIKDWLLDGDEFSFSTSGSTGDPKTISFSRSAIVASAQLTIKFFNLKPSSSLLLCLPIQYVASQLMVVRAFVGQMNLIVVEPNSNPLLNVHQVVDFVALVPLQVNHALATDVKLFDNVKQLIIGGSKVSDQLAQQLDGISTVCCETYGMTETLTHVALKPINGKGRSEFFTALAPITFAVGEKGELIINAPHISSYPIVTNDVVELQNSTTFKWVCRLDNVINSGGVKINSIQVSQKLESHINVPFEIIGMPHDVLGEQVVLVLESEAFSFNLLDVSTKAQLSRFEVPKMVRFLPQFPRSKAGKVLWQELRKLLY